MKSMTYKVRFPLTNLIPYGTINNNQERERKNMINTREKFMNKLWCSSGKTIKGIGTITEMRTTAGIDIEVTVNSKLMSGLKLWEEGAEII